MMPRRLPAKPSAPKAAAQRITGGAYGTPAARRTKSACLSPLQRWWRGRMCRVLTHRPGSPRPQGGPLSSWPKTNRLESHSCRNLTRQALKRRRALSAIAPRPMPPKKCFAHTGPSGVPIEPPRRRPLGCGPEPHGGLPIAPPATRARGGPAGWPSCAGRA